MMGISPCFSDVEILYIANLDSTPWREIHHLQGQSLVCLLICWFVDTMEFMTMW